MMHDDDNYTTVLWTMFVLVLVCFIKRRGTCKNKKLPPKLLLLFPVSELAGVKNIWRGIRRVSVLRRDPAVSAEDPTPIHTSHWKIDSDPLRCEFRAGCELFKVISNPHRTRNGRVRVCFQWYVWGFLWRQRSPYVIPRPGVPRHMYRVIQS